MSIEIFNNFVLVLVFITHSLFDRSRSSSVDTVSLALKEAFALRRAFPDVVTGFDLVSHEYDKFKVHS